ncbi:cysteine hydrolase family protein [Chloroflexota bacterium]
MTDKPKADGKALIVVDMQVDNVGRFFQEIIPDIRMLIDRARERKIPVFFALDSRYPDDFLFTRMGLPRSCIRGTAGVKVIEELGPLPTDYYVEKRMLSAFFGSDLDFTLRLMGVGRLIIVGVATMGCVFKTAMDAVEMGYEVEVVGDCCSAHPPEFHELGLRYLELFRLLRPGVKEVIEDL